MMQCRLQVDWYRIVNARADATLVEFRQDRITIPLQADTVYMIDVARAFYFNRCSEAGDLAQSLRIRLCHTSPGIIPLIEVRQLGRQDRGLQRIKTFAVADQIVQVFAAASVIAQFRDMIS